MKQDPSESDIQLKSSLHFGWKAGMKHSQFTVTSFGNTQPDTEGPTVQGEAGSSAAC